MHANFIYSFFRNFSTYLPELLKNFDFKNFTLMFFLNLEFILKTLLKSYITLGILIKNSNFCSLPRLLNIQIKGALLKFRH